VAADLPQQSIPTRPMTPRVPHHIRHYIVVLNQQGFSQREIGRHLGIAASTVGRYLNPRVRFRAQRRDNDRYYQRKAEQGGSVT
jgi:IS30 family transposase